MTVLQNNFYDILIQSIGLHLKYFYQVSSKSNSSNSDKSRKAGCTLLGDRQTDRQRQTDRHADRDRQTNKR